jgi:hypothetical protein
MSASASMPFEEAFAEYRALKRAVMGHHVPGQGRIWHAPPRPHAWFYHHRLLVSSGLSLALLLCGLTVYYVVPAGLALLKEAWVTTVPPVELPSFPVAPAPAKPVVPIENALLRLVETFQTFLIPFLFLGFVVAGFLVIFKEADSAALIPLLLSSLLLIALTSGLVALVKTLP